VPHSSLHLPFLLLPLLLLLMAEVGLLYMSLGFDSMVNLKQI
jgi:hypothetical protein